MKITLNAPIEIVEQKELKKTINSVTVVAFIDDFKSVIASISFNDDILNIRNITLWNQGEEYEKIGQYTDDDILNRVLELINTL
jgi:hypothetical protein